MAIVVLATILFPIALLIAVSLSTSHPTMSTKARNSRDKQCPNCHLSYYAGRSLALASHMQTCHKRQAPSRVEITGGEPLAGSRTLRARSLCEPEQGAKAYGSCHHNCCRQTVVTEAWSVRSLLVLLDHEGQGDVSYAWRSLVGILSASYDSPTIKRCACRGTFRVVSLFTCVVYISILILLPDAGTLL